MLSFTSRGQPRPVPSDDVLPARFFDDSPMVKDVVMRWLVRFDEILDPEKLHSSLDALLKRKTWRRLGGRLRLNVGAVIGHCRLRGAFCFWLTGTTVKGKTGGSCTKGI